MNLEELNEANINNISALWKKMGTQTRFKDYANNFHASSSWPYRCWFDWKVNVNEISTLDEILFQSQKNCIVPVWGRLVDFVNFHEKILIGQGFELLFEQTAMYLDLDNCDVISRINFEIATISSERDVEIWTNVAAESFGYDIDVSVIRKIANDPDLQLLLTYVDNLPAATAMLFRTGDIIGVHQVGVLKKYRGKGVARTLMYYIIERGIELRAKYITLQASVEGGYLYRDLGFKQQFMIQNYQRLIEK